MASLNRVTIIGNVGGAVEMKFTPQGKAVTTFNVAVNSKHGDNETTEWFNVITWEKLAEACNQYLDKGSSVYVEGRLQTRSWETDGVKHYRTELIAQGVQFLDRKPKADKSAEEDDGIPF